MVSNVGAQFTLYWKLEDSGLVDSNRVVFATKYDATKIDGVYFKTDLTLVETIELDLTALSRTMFGLEAILGYDSIYAIGIQVSSDSLGALEIAMGETDGWLPPWGEGVLHLEPDEAATFSSSAGWTVTTTQRILRLSPIGYDATITLVLLGKIIE